MTTTKGTNLLAPGSHKPAAEDKRTKSPAKASGCVGMMGDCARAAAQADLQNGLNGKAQAPAWLVTAAFAAIYLIWGSTYLAAKYALESIPPFFLGGSRFIAAGSALYVFARLCGSAPPRRTEWWSAAKIGALMLVVGAGGVMWAQLTIPSGVAALVVALTPLWIVLFEWLRGTHPGARVLIGLALGLLGVVVLTRGLDAQAIPNYAWGVGLVVVSSLSWAYGSLLNRGAKKPAAPLLAVAIQMLAGGSLMLVVGLMRGEVSGFSITQVTAVSGAAWLYLTLAGSLVAFTAYVWLLQVSSPSRVATYAYVNPLIAMFLGYAIAREPLTVELGLAAGLILSAVALIIRSKGTRTVPAPIPVRTGAGPGRPA